MKRMSFAVLISLFFLFFPHPLFYFFPQPFLKPHLLSPFSSFPPLAEWWSESVSHSAMFNSLQVHGQQPTRLLCPWDSPDTNTGVGCRCNQEIFPTQGLNPGLLRCRQILYHLNPHQGSSGECKFNLAQALRQKNKGGMLEGGRGAGKKGK